MGLTDGWFDVLSAIRDVIASVRLPSDEVDTLTEVAAAIETALEHRK